MNDTFRSRVNHKLTSNPELTENKRSVVNSQNWVELVYFWQIQSHLQFNLHNTDRNKTMKSESAHCLHSFKRLFPAMLLDNFNFKVQSRPRAPCEGPSPLFLQVFWCVDSCVCPHDVLREDEDDLVCLPPAGSV